MLDQATNRYTGRYLTPYMDPNNALQDPVNIGPSQVVLMGTPLSQVLAAQNDVQTLTITGAPGGGTFIVNVSIDGSTVSTPAQVYNVTGANLQAALLALTNVGAGNLTVTGNGPYVITFLGTLASRPIPLITTTNSFTGGTAPNTTIAHTTTGQSLGTWTAYSGTTVGPTAAPTITGAGAGSAFAAGTYGVQITYSTANGESTPSPATFVTLTAAQNIHGAAIAGLDASVTNVNYYADGVYIGTVVPAAGTAAAADFSGAALTIGRTPPTKNTAFSAANGQSRPTRLNAYDLATDSSGRITYGQSTAGVSPVGPYGGTDRAAPAFFSGTFRTIDIPGLDQNAVDSLGKLTSGTIADGVLRIG